MTEVLERLGEDTDSPSWRALIEAAAGHLAFDIGGNTGQTARVLAQHFDRVVSYEPCREAFELLEAETPSNVVPVEAAVSDHVGTVTLIESAQAIRTGQLTSPDDPMSMWGAPIGNRTCASTTVDSQVDLFGAPNLVKVDVEGHELHVLAGAAALIARRSTLWLVEVHSRAFEEPIRRVFDGYRVDVFDHDRAPAPWPNFYLRAVPR